MKLRMAFVMDPVGTINTEKDTTFVLMLEAQARGHEVFYLELKDLFVKNAKAFGSAALITLKRGADYYKLGDKVACFNRVKYDCKFLHRGGRKVHAKRDPSRRRLRIAGLVLANWNEGTG